MLHRCVTTLMANGPGFGFSWVKCNMVLSDAKYTDIGVPLFFVPRIYYLYICKWMYKSILILFFGGTLGCCLYFVFSIFVFCFVLLFVVGWVVFFFFGGGIWGRGFGGGRFWYLLICRGLIFKMWYLVLFPESDSNLAFSSFVCCSVKPDVIPGGNEHPSGLEPPEGMEVLSDLIGCLRQDGWVRAFSVVDCSANRHVDVSPEWRNDWCLVLKRKVFRFVCLKFLQE